MHSHHLSRYVSLLLLALAFIGPMLPRVQSSGATSLGIWSNDYFSNVIVDPALTNGSSFIVEVQVQGIPQGGMNGLDITILYDPGVVKATDASLKAPLCPTFDGCLFDSSNVLILAQNVNSPSGTVRLSATLLGKVATGSGVLFRIVFQVVGIGASPIDIQESTSFIVLGGTVIPYKSTDGSFDNTGPPQPDFNMIASPSSLTLQLGSSGNATVYLSSLNGFAADVVLTLDVSPNPPNGILASLSQYAITLGVDETATLMLSVSTNNGTQTGKYTVTVTGTSDVLSHATSLSVRATGGPGAGFSFRDDFDQNSLSELEANGWAINQGAPLEYHSIGSGVLTLLNDGTYGGRVDWNHAPAGVSDWTLTVRGSWVGNSVGSIYLVIYSQAKTYFWQADGYYGNFVFGDLATWWAPFLSVPGYQPQLNVWHDLRVDLEGGLFSLYFDGQLKGTYQEPNPSNLAGIGIPAAWMAYNSFDFVEVSELTNGPDYSLQATPSSITLDAGNSGISTITVKSKGGFSGDVSLTASSSANISSIVSPSVVTLVAEGSITSTLTVSTSNATTQGSYTIEISGASGLFSHTISVSVTVTRPNQPPVAVAESFPPNPFVGDLVQFNGYGSYDPDGYVVNWFWQFGDGNVGYGPYTYNVYSSPGAYTVMLSVTDDRGGTGSSSITVEVRRRPIHDVAVYGLAPTPNLVVSGQMVLVQVGLVNYGQVDETIDVVVYFDQNVAAEVSGITVPYGAYGFTVPVFWSTFGVAPGNYTLSAVAILASDEVVDNNSLSDGLVTILPPPILSLTPNTGSLGTKVTVRGSGFPENLPIPIVIPRPVIVSFDDEFLGTAFIEGGEFSFVFNLQHSEPGPHEVKAFDIAVGLTVTQQFDVLPEPVSPGVLGVSLEVGAVYFQGDTVDVFVLVTLDGSPLASPDQLQLSLVKLDGTNLNMVPAALGQGVYKASYALPRNAVFGTYAVIVHVGYGDLDASGLATFEIKPSWISSQGPRIATATLAVGIIATLGLAWKMGYLRKKEMGPTSGF